MTRFQKRPTVNDQDRRQATRRRVEIAAAVLIPTLVVGIPFLTNYSRSNPTSVVTSGRPAAGDLTDATPITVAPSVLGATAEIADPPVDSLTPIKPDSTFWDLYQIAGLAGGGLVPVAPASTTTTTGPTAPGAGSTPTSTPSTTTPTTSPPIRTASVPKSPTNLVADFGSPSLLARWDPVSTNTNGTAFTDFKAYEITFSARGLSATYETTSTSLTYTFGQNQSDFGAPQPELTVTVRAVADTGARSGPLAGVATNDVPATPTEPDALAPGSTQITVTEPLQGPIDDLAGFDIYHSESAAGPFQLIASTVAYQDYVHDGLLPGSTHNYFYKIRDVFGQVSPGFSPTATATTS
jgi:hypothetical protein